VPDLADGYIAGAMTLDAVRTHLATVTAHLDKAEIDAHLDPNAGVVDHAASWKKVFGRVNGGGLTTKH
jgi:hypothetical protein